MADVRVVRWGSVRALHAVVDGLAGEVSAARLKQLRMVVGMWGRVAEQWPEGAGSPPSRSPRALFETRALRVFWDLAGRGMLRARAEDAGRPLSVATRQTVRSCLRELAEVVVPGRRVWAPALEWPKLAPPVDRRQLPVLYRTLVDLAADAPVEVSGVVLSREDRVRLLAMVAVVLDTGANSAELEGMTVAGLGEGLGSVVVVRRPQNGPLPAGDGPREVCGLRDGTRVAVRRWLEVRDGLVAGFEGKPPGALWVSLTPNQWQERPGFPLQAQGIRKGFTRGVVALNAVMAGREGWEPLPTTLERLRRAVVVPGTERPRLRRGRPRVMSPEMVEAARVLLRDRSRSLASVAAEVGVGTMTLYGAVPDLRELRSGAVVEDAG